MDFCSYSNQSWFLPIFLTSDAELGVPIKASPDATLDIDGGLYQLLGGGVVPCECVEAEGIHLYSGCS